MSLSKKLKGICYGIHAVAAALDSRHRDIEKIYIEKFSVSSRILELEGRAKKVNICVSRCGKHDLNQLTNYGNHQGIAATSHLYSANYDYTVEEVIQRCNERSGVILVLDHLQDPQNLGACLRTAECAGVQAVVLPRDSACPINQTVYKVASGAVETLKIVHVSNIVSVLKKFKKNGFWVYGTAEQGTQNLYDCSFDGKIVLVMGNEGQGMRRLTAETCDFLIQVPVSGSISSLNVSVAAGIFLYEIRRQLNRAVGKD